MPFKGILLFKSRHYICHIRILYIKSPNYIWNLYSGPQNMAKFPQNSGKIPGKIPPKMVPKFPPPGCQISCQNYTEKVIS